MVRGAKPAAVTNTGGPGYGIARRDGVRGSAVTGAFVGRCADTAGGGGLSVWMVNPRAPEQLGCCPGRAGSHALQKQGEPGSSSIPAAGGKGPWRPYGPPGRSVESPRWSRL